METSRLLPERTTSPRAVTSHIRSVDTLYVIPFCSCGIDPRFIWERTGGYFVYMSSRSNRSFKVLIATHVQARASVGILRELR